MVKHVVDSRTVSHLFANQSQDWAKNAGNTFSFSGKTLKSWSTIVARFVTLRDNSELLILDNKFHSKTTAKQMHWVRVAASHLATMEVDNFDEVIRLVVGQFGVTLDLAKWAIARFAQIDDLRGKEKRARSEWSKAGHVRHIAKIESLVSLVWHEATGEKPADIRDTAKTFVEGYDRDKAIARYAKALADMQGAVNLPLLDPIEIIGTGGHVDSRNVAEFRERAIYDRLESMTRLLPHDISADFAFVDSKGLNEATRLMGKKYVPAYYKAQKAFAPLLAAFVERRKAAWSAYKIADDLRMKEWQARQDAGNAEKLAAWFALESDYPPRVSVIQCRVKGDEVQTTQGARVPLSDALAMVRLAKACRASGKEYAAPDKVGSFRLNKVSAAGDLTIGCHFIPWDSIVAAMARYMGEVL